MSDLAHVIIPGREKARALIEALMDVRVLFTVDGFCSTHDDVWHIWVAKAGLPVVVDLLGSPVAVDLHVHPGIVQPPDVVGT